jgi:hypothetical protein
MDKFLTAPKTLPPEDGNFEAAGRNLKRLLSEMKNLNERKCSNVDILRVLKKYFSTSLQEKIRKNTYMDQNAPSLTGENNGKAKIAIG